ncbi:hypothetical protein IJU85_03060 [Candidatus Saccharibacteria bacterium]|nr:hypothetical protein [Candidatus Saccharibacteria bacterium]
MINIVHVEYRCDDQREINALQIKLKSFKSKDEDNVLTGHYLAATISSAFFKTTLLTDEGKSLKTIPNPKRNNIVDLVIDLKDNKLSFKDVALFLDAFQKAIDETNLF